MALILKALFDKVFIEGIHDPSKRPSAAEWEDALIKTCDLVQPCQNPQCEYKWFVFDNTTKPRCPFCGHEYHGQLPILNFYYSPAHGKFISEQYRLMVYDKQTLYMWHVNRFIVPNEKTKDEDKKPAGDFHFFKNQWILINRRLPSMFEPFRRWLKEGNSCWRVCRINRRKEDTALNGRWRQTRNCPISKELEIAYGFRET